FAMQFTVSFDHRSTNLFGERWSKLTVNCMANPLAGLSGLGADRDHAAERALAPGDRGNALVVDPVLEVDHHAVRLLEVLDAERRGPLGVVRLDRDEDRVERLADGLRFVDVERLDADRVVPAC